MTNREQEEAATELGAELLLPAKAALAAARCKASNEAVALQYGVSVAMARWRLDATGARIVASRVEKARRRRS
jgi:Zn-dependent peptidase ImmA (M78 family)